MIPVIYTDPNGRKNVVSFKPGPGLLELLKEGEEKASIIINFANGSSAEYINQEF